MPNLLIGEDPAPGAQAPVFKIFTGALKAFQREDGRKYLSCTASSSVEDLHGDIMTDDCVRGMAPQAKQKAMTIFLNHSYKVPEDVFGKTVDASIVSRATNKDGTPVYDLDLEIVLNEANSRAIETYAAIKDQDVKLGVSIGAMIEDYEFIDEDKGWWGGLKIKEVNLLEASIVGIPANPRSWVQNAVRALKSWNAAQPVALEVGEIDMTASIKQAVAEAISAQSTTTEITAAVEPEVSESTESTETTDETPTDEEATAETSTEPEVTTGALADETTPEATAEAGTIEEPTNPVDLEAALEAAEASQSPLVFIETLRQAFIDAMAALRDVESERDAAIAAKDEAEANLALAMEIVEKIASTPLGSKTRVAQGVSEFRSKFAGIYDESLLKLLDERNPQ